MISQGVSSSQGTSKKSGEKEKETASSSTNHSLPDPLATALLKVLATVLQCFATASPEEKEVATLVQRMGDLIRYVEASLLSVVSLRNRTGKHTSVLPSFFFCLPVA